jgi:hypothetical protein
MGARIMPSAVSCTCGGTDALPASVVEPGQVYAFCNVILDPVAVPPFLRVNLNAIEYEISKSSERPNWPAHWPQCCALDERGR